MTADPFAVLGLPPWPDLDDETVQAAWRLIAAETFPGRPDGGDPARYTQAFAAYAELNPLGPHAKPTPTRSKTRTAAPSPFRSSSTTRPPPGPPPAAAAAPLPHHPRPADAPAHPRRRLRRAVPARAAADPCHRRRARRRGRPDLVLRPARPLRPCTPALTLTAKDQVGAGCRAASILYPPARRGTLAGQGRGARPANKGRARAARPRRRAYGPPAMPGPAPARTPAKQSPAAPAAITADPPHKYRRTNK